MNKFNLINNLALLALGFFNRSRRRYRLSAAVLGGIGGLFLLIACHQTLSAHFSPATANFVFAIGFFALAGWFGFQQKHRVDPVHNVQEQAKQWAETAVLKAHAYYRQHPYRILGAIGAAAFIAGFFTRNDDTNRR